MRSACLSVCMSDYMSQKRHASKQHQILFYMPPVAVARFSSCGIAIYCVLPVLWMPSCFHIMQVIGQNQRRRVCFVQNARWWRGMRGDVCHLRLYLVTGPPNGPVLLCTMSSVDVVCRRLNARGQSAAAGPGAWPVRRPTLHVRTVRLRPVRRHLV